MKPFTALLTREWLEHKDGFIWVPIVVAAILLTAAIAFSTMASQTIIETKEESTRNVDGVVHTEKVEVTQSLADYIRDARGDRTTGDASAMDLKDFFLVPVLIISLFVLVASTFDERSNGSILFFKSMPVSDWRTILSKFAFVAWVAPAVALACYLTTQLLFVLWSNFSSASVVDFAGHGLLSFVGLIIDSAVRYLLYGLWLLPLFAWFLFIGAWANSTPLLWAFGLPFGLSLLEENLLNTEFIKNFVGSHVARGMGEHPSLDGTLGAVAQLTGLFTLNFAVGLLLGAGLLAAAVYMRQTRNRL